MTSTLTRVRKGELTRQTILEHAIRLASKIGLEALSIGRLADELELSKSGLFAHFRSKEALQIQVLEHAASRFIDAVVRPALESPRGEPRVRALFERWLAWARHRPLPGGCLFVAAATEFDDRPGPIRDEVARKQQSWMGALSRCASIAVQEGHFAPETDTRLFAYELHGILLAYHHASRLLGDPSAEAFARASLESLVARSRSTAPKKKG